jgi:hypothetical protein
MLRTFFLIITLSISITSAWSQIVINEVCPSNADIIYSPRFFNFDGWIELHNTSKSTINLTGYYLSNDEANPKLWPITWGTTIPPKGYVLIWCNEKSVGVHANFSLRPKGGQVLLTNSANTVIDKITYPEQYTNIAYGRVEDGGTEFAYLTMPTPAASNSTGAPAYGGQLKAPLFSVEAGKYAADQNVTLSNPNALGELRYTIDGSEPDHTSTLFTAPISVTKPTTIKAKVFAPDYLPSETVTNTYFVGYRNITLPVISLSTKPAYLTDNTIGIYVNGTNGIGGYCQDGPRNFNQDWKRHAVFEYFDASGKRQFHQHIDLGISGGCSRGNPQKSFALKARNKYGDNEFKDFKFFDTKHLYRFGSLLLRNSGNDYWQTHMRDAMMQELIREHLDIDHQAYQPVVVFRNGQYQGIMNLRERLDPDYLTANYGYSPDEVDMMEVDGKPMAGKNTAYQNYLNGLDAMDRTTVEAFQYMDQHIDVQEFINYNVAQVYYGNTDWPGNNLKYWRHHNGKFRWMIYDTDGGFQNAEHQTLHVATDPTKNAWPNPSWSTWHFRMALENPIFRERFIQTFSAAMGSLFEPSRVHEVIDFMKNRIAKEMPYHVAKWNMQSMNGWEWNVQALKDFATARHAFMPGYLTSYFGLNGQVSLSFSGTPATAAGVVVNGVILPSLDKPIPYFSGIQYKIQVAPKPGYRFVSWNITKQHAEEITLVTKNDTWKYYDKGMLPASDWNQVSYMDDAWASGQGQLGYGENDENTVVSYGPEANKKFVTTYFRKTVEVADTTGLTNIEAAMIYDDGAIVYVNGVEVFRGNMPTGTVEYATYSLGNTPTENQYHAFIIPKSVLVPGLNTIAVELHQISATSTDLSFDLTLKTRRLGAKETFTSDAIVLQDVADRDVHFEAVFEEVPRIESLVINEVCASNSRVEDEHGDKDDFIELYNPTDEDIDIAGLFITDKLSNKLRHHIGQGKENETIIPAKGYKVLWADQEIFQGPMHLNFKLSASGDAVGLYQKVGENVYTLDQMEFTKLYPNVSLSRFPDGTGPFELTRSLTPGAANVYEIPLSTEKDVNDLIQLYPNPTDGLVHFNMATGVKRIQLMNSVGVVVRTYPHHTTSLDLSDLQAGMYLLVFHTEDFTLTKRIIKH